MNSNSQLVRISTMNRLSTQRSNRISRLMMMMTVVCVVFFFFELMFVDDCFPSSKNSRYSMYIHSDISDKNKCKSSKEVANIAMNEEEIKGLIAMNMVSYDVYSTYYSAYRSNR